MTDAVKSLEDQLQDQKQSLEEKVGDRIFSRLAQMCDFVKMEGEDYRTKIKPPPRTIRNKD